MAEEGKIGRSSIRSDDDEKDEDPFLKLKPPEIDYLTYLTLIETQLTRENLNSLHGVLSDVKLTVNLGWDLVHILIPLMPEARPCLERIAELGNPREVLLKVTESLRAVEFGVVEDGEHTEVEEKAEGKEKEQQRKRGLPVVQFKVLVSMLLTLHERVQTKFPSRFISTTLQGVMATLSNASSRELIFLLPDTIKFAHTLLAVAKKGPKLPPRDGTTSTTTSANASSVARELQADPEASNAGPAPEDFSISKKLLQAFTTHLAELFLAPPDYGDRELPGLSWSARLFEKYHPEKVVPGQQTYTPWVPNNALDELRLEIIDSLLELSRILDLGMKDLIAEFAKPSHNTIVEQVHETKDLESEPPESADDIPLSIPGSLLLYSSKMMPEYLDPESKEQFDIPIFPWHLNTINNLIGTEENGGTNTAGSEPEAVIDSCLALGILALEYDMMGEPSNDDEFDWYLQKMSLLAANTPSSILRFHAHFITTTVLRSHPSDTTRLAYIRDTLENCPYDNLRTVAVGWLKGEIVEANPIGEETNSTIAETSLFTTPIALDILAPLLFPDLTKSYTLVFDSDDIIVEEWTHFKANISFYLAVLNFYYLLMTATHVCKKLEIAELQGKHNIKYNFLAALQTASKLYQQGLNNEGGAQILGIYETGQSKDLAKSDLMLLEDALMRVSYALASLAV